MLACGIAVAIATTRTAPTAKASASCTLAPMCRPTMFRADAIARIAAAIAKVASLPEPKRGRHVVGAGKRHDGLADRSGDEEPPAADRPGSVAKGGAREGGYAACVRRAPREAGEREGERQSQNRDERP